MDTPIMTLRDWVRQYWESVDWTKSNFQIAYECGVSAPSVARWRLMITHKIKQPERFNSRTRHIDWAHVDWNKNDSILSKETGIASGTIAAIRYRQSKPFPTINRWNRKISKDMLDGVDWEWTTDMVIAKQLGVSRERIRQIRSQFSKPDCKVSHIQAHEKRVAFRWAVEHKEQLTGLYTGEAIKKICDAVPDAAKLKTYDFIDILVKGRVDFKRGPYGNKRDIEHGFPWEKVNWKLPNIALALIYGFGKHCYANYRNQHRPGQPAWWFGGFCKPANDPEFLKAFEEEQAKAESLGFIVDRARVAEWLAYRQARKTWNDFRAERLQKENSPAATAEGSNPSVEGIERELNP